MIKNIFILLFYASAFFAPWGEGMQHVFSSVSSIFPLCVFGIIVLYPLFRYKMKRYHLPKAFKIFFTFIFIHTLFYVIINPSVLTFGTTEVAVTGNNFIKGKTSSGDAILKFFAFGLYSCILFKSLCSGLVKIPMYLLAFCCGFCSTIIIGGYQNEYSNDLVRISGGLTDPNAMAVDSLVALSFALFLLNEVKVKAKINRVIFLFMVAVSAYALIMSFSRGGMLALFLMTVMYLKRKYKFIKIIFCSIFIFLILFIIYKYIIPSDFRETLSMRFDFDEAKETGGSNRMGIWTAYLARWMYYFITGTGFGNCSSVLQQHSTGVEVSLNYVTHNQYLLYFVEQGLLGLILYLNYIVRGIKVIEKTSKKMLFLALPLMGYATATFFVNLSGGRTVWIVFAFINFIYAYNKRKEYEQNISIRSLQ